MNVRSDFPALDQEVHGRPLVYLDNAATSQKPAAVIEAIGNYYSRDNANVHRGLHTLSERATAGYEGARETARRFLGARSTTEIVFVRGATEGINLVAQSWGRANVGKGDEVVISTMEHHSNIVPWQLLCEEKGAALKVAPINDAGELELDELVAMLSDKTKLVALVHVSNALGTVNPVQRVIEAAHDRGIPVLLDGAQAAPHLALDVAALDVDFYTMSAHKAFGPTGAGVLYGREALLEAMPPWQGGGEMISTVSFETGTTWNKLPHKFEAGTPNIAGAIGMGAAMEYLEEAGLDKIAAYEDELLAYGTELLESLDGIKLIGTARKKAGVLSFTVEDVHPHDVGTILDREGVAIRAGHHCAQPVMTRFGVPATARASLALYNNREDLDRLGDGLKRVREVFG